MSGQIRLGKLPDFVAAADPELAPVAAPTTEPDVLPDSWFRSEAPEVAETDPELRIVDTTPEGFSVLEDGEGNRFVDVPDEVLERAVAIPAGNTAVRAQADFVSHPSLGQPSPQLDGAPYETGYISLTWHKDNRVDLETSGHRDDVREKAAALLGLQSVAEPAQTVVHSLVREQTLTIAAPQPATTYDAQIDSHPQLYEPADEPVVPGMASADITAGIGRAINLRTLRKAAYYSLAFLVLQKTSSYGPGGRSFLDFSDPAHLFEVPVSTAQDVAGFIHNLVSFGKS